ncbi:hypothetical protein CS063_03905 [Sporanaerobium hydrogeniformans]|uniref:Uncharacterized protein n=1 Tax=Sporanaerobium hydrogeniformans TaxID=3072179 RepID=A0AC61DEH6_9FIRM|nr:hypothetical protein [Sporanaerobium hydrogeniformans]PHV71714.1 hypothetical protein CS063_03905 [Sporanaerobium hydrogeniformans]
MLWKRVMTYGFRILFVLSGIYELVVGDFGKGGLLFASLLLTFVPEIFTKLLQVRVTPGAIMSYQLFIFCSQWLGTYLRCYDIFFWWDILLHFTSGILLDYVGLLVLMCLDREQLLIKHKKWLLIVLFMSLLSLAGAGIWEIFEFTSDSLLGTRTQLGSLQDTMEDIVYGTLGAALYSMYMYLAIHKGKRTAIETLQMYNEKEV